MKYSDCLLQCDLFDGMDSFMIEQFLQYTNAQLHTIPRGKIQRLEEFTQDHVVIVTKGTLKVISEIYNPNSDYVVEFLMPGQAFGLAISILGQSAPGHVRAASLVNCLLIPASYLKNGCSTDFPYYQQINKNLIFLLANRVHENAVRLHYLRYPTLRKRLAAYLCHYGPAENGIPFNLPLNKSVLAEFLGVSRPTLVRLLSTMQGEGLIAYQLNSYTLLDRGSLEECLM